jgi:hypothetical protein
MCNRASISALLRTVVFVVLCFVAPHADAATLKLNPSTGVYTVGKTFTVSVVLSTDGKSVNAADGQISFNPRELSVTGATRGSSIFNLWTEEPTFSNSAGTVSFGGGSPTGYTGASGNIISVTFKALGAGTPKVSFKSGSVLAADGMGTNVLTGMNGGTYTVAAATESPAPEQIIEYVAPANTPKAPTITSETHPDQTKWYKEKTAKLSWNAPSDVVALRTLLDTSAGTVPTIVYDAPFSKKTLDNLAEGVSYFHIQFKNKDGWGKVSHYKFAIDSKSPESFTITEATTTDVVTSGTILLFTYEDISPIDTYTIQIDGAEQIEFKDEKNTKRYTLPALSPGRHTIIVEAFDSAGNSTTATHSITVAAFEKPVFIEFPSRINTEVIPAIKGKTRPHAKVAIEVKRASDGMLIQTVEGSEDTDPYTIESDANGEFVYIPNSSFERGVYTITAVAKDEHGLISERSDEIRIVVETPGYVVFGTMMISVLSVVIPLCALVLLMVFGSWYLWHRLSRWKKRVHAETIEAENKLATEFSVIVSNLNSKVELLKKSRKGKLTIAETELIMQIEADLRDAQVKIGKEIEDIEDVIS